MSGIQQGLLASYEGATPSTLLTGLTAYWKLDESSGNASDSVSSNTLTNNGTLSYSTGKINNAADFGSSNSSKWLSNSNAIVDTSTSNSYTASIWANITTAPTLGSEMIIIDLQKSVGRQQQIRYINSGGTLKIRLLNWDGVGQSTYDYTQTLTTGTWYHFILTKSNNSYELYINNSIILSGTFTNTNNSNGTDVTSFGRHGGASFGYLSGLVDEIALYSRVITGTEKTSIYNSGNGLQYPF